MRSHLLNHRCASLGTLAVIQQCSTHNKVFFLAPRQNQCQRRDFSRTSNSHFQQRCAESLSTESVHFYFMLEYPARRISMWWRRTPRRPYIHNHTHTETLQLRIQRQRMLLLPFSHSTHRVTFSDSALWVTGSQHWSNNELAGRRKLAKHFKYKWHHWLCEIQWIIN